MDLKGAAGMSRDARHPRGMCLARPGLNFQSMPSSQTRRMILKWHDLPSASIYFLNFGIFYVGPYFLILFHYRKNKLFIFKVSTCPLSPSLMVFSTL